MQNVAELPAEDGAAGQREADSIGPEGEGALLMVCAENDACRVKGQGQVQARGWGDRTRGSQLETRRPRATQRARTKGATGLGSQNPQNRLHQVGRVWGWRDSEYPSWEGWVQSGGVERERCRVGVPCNPTGQDTPGVLFLHGPFLRVDGFADADGLMGKKVVVRTQGSPPLRPLPKPPPWDPRH